jgi:spore coat-associated protein S
VIKLKNQFREPLEQILAGYDFNVLSIKSETYKEKKAVWWVETDRGLMVLKKISNSEQTLKFTISAIKHLSKNGIHIPPIVETKDGTDYAVADGTCYVVTQAIKGKNPSYDSAKELEIIVKGLAEFHAASRGFQVLPGTKPKIHLGQWEEDLTSQIEDMKGFYDKEASVNGSNEIGKFIVNEFPYFYERALRAIDSLRSDDYRAWVEKAKLQGALCHQDFAAGNLILHPTGTLYVLDTDGITIDIPARDLRKILCKVMKKSGKWDFELAKKMLRFYQSVNPLEPSEWRVVRTDIMFPHLFIGAMNKYYYKRDKEWSEEKYFKKIKEMCHFEKTIEPILDNFEMLIP